MEKVIMLYCPKCYEDFEAPKNPNPFGDTFECPYCKAKIYYQDGECYEYEEEEE